MNNVLKDNLLMINVYNIKLMKIYANNVMNIIF